MQVVNVPVLVALIFAIPVDKKNAVEIFQVGRTKSLMVFVTMAGIGALLTAGLLAAVLGFSSLVKSTATRLRSRA